MPPGEATLAALPPAVVPGRPPRPPVPPAGLHQTPQKETRACHASFSKGGAVTKRTAKRIGQWRNKGGTESTDAM